MPQSAVLYIWKGNQDRFYTYPVNVRTKQNENHDSRDCRHEVLKSAWLKYDMTMESVYKEISPCSHRRDKSKLAINQ